MSANPKEQPHEALATDRIRQIAQKILDYLTKGDLPKGVEEREVILALFWVLDVLARRGPDLGEIVLDIGLAWVSELNKAAK